ncbi:CopG family transcriptional regulator [Micromonospora chalcea]|uniref:CopG family transcriptional regulator n=2 Tax=Micromonosporaceae TaxID=28056 RepID=A0ABX9Y3B3_MICCH|nr:CopG family transcriptional regulator [Micromonospora chalcea]RQX57928.1 CopG family transcriptional regulator [Micromonospora chalcea]
MASVPPSPREGEARRRTAPHIATGAAHRRCGCGILTYARRGEEVRSDVKPSSAAGTYAGGGARRSTGTAGSRIDRYPASRRGVAMSKETPEATSGQMRLSVNLSADAAEAIRELTERRGITITELIRRAISTQKYVDDAVNRGAKILIEEPDEKLRELIFVL